jgi:hypothetical protein
MCICFAGSLGESLAMAWTWLMDVHDQTFFATLAGAFAGACAAFLLESMRRAREEKRRKIGAANIALLTLSSMWWELYNYESQVVRPKISDRLREVPLWLKISPAVRRAPDLKFDIPALGFLLHSVNPEVLPELVLQEQRYRDFVAGVEQRDAAISRARDRMDAKNIGAERYATDAELKDVIGIRGIGELRTMTAGMIRAMYQTLEDMAAVYGQLLNALRRDFGKQNIKAFELEQSKLNGDLKPSPAAWVKAAIAECNSRPSGP